MQLHVEHLTLKFENRVALDDLTATLEGRIIAVLGANGSGKTSFLQILAGTTPPTGGRVWINREQVHAGRRSGISYLPQETGFFPFWQKPRETLSATFLLRGMPGSDPSALLEALGLEDEDRSAGEFSGGMKQKMRIAQALAHAPRLLILDEPTTGLDVRERFRLLRVIERLRERVAVIFSTHQPEDAAAVSDQLLILHRGRAAAAGTPGEIRARATGRVFELSLDSPALPAARDYEIVQAERDGGQLKVRVVSAEPVQAPSVAARLEDAYVLLTQTP